MSSNDAPRSTLPIHALLIALGGIVLGVYALLQSPITGEVVGFDLNKAMEAAGAHVPEQIESFYFFVPEATRSHDEDVVELAALLAKAASERDYIGVAGPDTERNLTELLDALGKNRSNGLKGLILVYLGPETHRGTVETAVTTTGASVKFVLFPAPSINSI
ncbi:MAG: hypothetical protein AABY95_00375 [Pseudomonadota bacterium]